MNKKLEEFNNKLIGKKIAIVGLGVSNLPLLDYFKYIDCEVSIFNEKKIEFDLSNYNYKVYVDGYVDDNLRFYVNSTNMPSESHYNSWCDWITGTIVKSVGYNHYWQNELMGTLNAGDHGGLLAYSSSGCCYWKNPGKVWLELVP